MAFTEFLDFGYKWILVGMNQVYQKRTTKNMISLGRKKLLNISKPYMK